MSIKQDVKTIATKSVSVPMSAGATTLTMTADGLGYIESGIKSTPAVVKALLTMPFAAAKGYIMEAEGVSAEEASLRAYKYVDQELSRTIEEAGEASGKLLAELLKDEPTTDGTASKELVGPTQQ
jgi:hypothetical protein